MSKKKPKGNGLVVLRQNGMRTFLETFGSLVSKGFRKSAAALIVEVIGDNTLTTDDKNAFVAQVWKLLDDSAWGRGPFDHEDVARVVTYFQWYVIASAVQVEGQGDTIDPRWLEMAMKFWVNVETFDEFRTVLDHGKVEFVGNAD
jgi:hypothetical protein